jgi:hypothetical protein
MQINWNSIESLIGNLLLVSIPSLSANELANILWSVGNRKTKSSDVQDEILSALIDKFIYLLEDFSSYEFAWSMWSFANMNIVWNRDFSVDMSKLIIDAAEKKAGIMTRQEIGVLLWSLVKMQV